MTGVEDHDRRIRLQSRRFVYRLEDVAAEFVGRDEVVRILGLAALSREHVLLLGPPGTAKTAVINAFQQMLTGAHQFSYLLTRFTEPAELYGPLDVQLFNDESTFRFNTDGMLPKAHLAFLDEVFSGSSAILNTLLTLINERVFYNGSEKQPANLHLLLGSTNELPTDPVLAAFSDRFLLRCKLGYVGADQLGRLLDKGWEHERRLARPAVAEDQDRSRFSLPELEELQRELVSVDLTPVRDLLLRTLRALDVEGVRFSDRRAVKAQKLVAASALLGSRKVAVREDLGVLAYMWTEKGDDETIRKVLEELEVPVEVGGRPVRDRTEVELDFRNATQGRQGGSGAEREQHVYQLHDLLQEAEADHPDLAETIRGAYEQAVAELENDRGDGPDDDRQDDR